MKRLLLLIPFVLIVLAGCQNAAPSEIPVTNAVTCEAPYIEVASGCCLDNNSNSVCDNEEPAVQTPASPKVSSVKQKPEEIRYCNISYAISWAEASNPCQINQNLVVAKLMYTGKGNGVDGMWFYITTESGKEVYLKDSKPLTPKGGREYSLNIGEPVTKVIAVPMRIEDGIQKACLNQRMLVIGSGLCRN